MSRSNRPRTAERTNRGSRTLGARQRVWPLAAQMAALSVLVGITLSGTVEARALQGEEDPALDQTIAAGQQVVTGAVEIAIGHIDLGPLFADGEWQLMFHDAARQPAVWRHPDDVVLRVGDAGKVEVPPDGQYGFIGAAPGESVWVVPQTENPGVVWLGWNTQDPQVMELIDRGVRLRLVGVDGPGKVSVYLQSGNLSGPEVLWESGTDTTDPLWVEVNSHTHANWVYSAPGAYVLRLEAVADLLDGTEVRDIADVRVAVGDATPTAEATAATFDAAEAVSSEQDDIAGGEVSPDEESRASPSPTGAGDDGGSGSSVVLVIVAAAALGLLGAAVFGVLRSGAARRRVERDRVRR